MNGFGWFVCGPGPGPGLAEALNMDCVESELREARSANAAYLSVEPKMQSDRKLPIFWSSLPANDNYSINWPLPYSFKPRDYS